MRGSMKKVRDDRRKKTRNEKENKEGIGKRKKEERKKAKRFFNCENKLITWFLQHYSHKCKNPSVAGRSNETIFENHINRRR